jgi:hypothetical protein
MQGAVYRKTGLEHSGLLLKEKKRHRLQSMTRKTGLEHSGLLLKEKKRHRLQSMTRSYSWGS